MASYITLQMCMHQPSDFHADLNHAIVLTLEKLRERKKVCRRWQTDKRHKKICMQRKDYNSRNFHSFHITVRCVPFKNFFQAYSVSSVEMHKLPKKKLQFSKIDSLFDSTMDFFIRLLKRIWLLNILHVLCLCWTQ